MLFLRHSEVTRYIFDVRKKTEEIYKTIGGVHRNSNCFEGIFSRIPFDNKVYFELVIGLKNLNMNIN